MLVELMRAIVHQNDTTECFTISSCGSQTWVSVRSTADCFTLPLGFPYLDLDCSVEQPVRRAGLMSQKQEGTKTVQKRSRMVEAVMFFDEHSVCRQMLFPEFEAVLDGVVGLPDLADQQVRLAYLMISSTLEVTTAVFFYLDFDENGTADPGWNIPLRQLSERAGPGMEFGAGPIRLVCRSQCPVPWHQMHLWDAEPQDLLSLHDAAKRNQLGLLGDEDGVSGHRRACSRKEAKGRLSVPSPARIGVKSSARRQPA